MNVKSALYAILAGSVLSGALVSPPRAVRADDNDPIKPEIVKLALTPAAEPMPALKYVFTPQYLDQVNGNAVQFYYRAVYMQAGLPKDVQQQYTDNWEAWHNGPLDEPTKASLRTWIDQHANIIAELEKAFRQTECNWDLGLRELHGPDIYSLLLPELQDARQVARMLSLRARLATAEGRYDDAIHSLRLGYALGQAVSKQPTLISSLVGIAISGIMNADLENLIAAADSPNLYWAIASLPRPLIDIRQSLQQEMAFPLQMFPFLKDAETVSRSPDEWRRLFADAFKQFAGLGAKLPVNVESWQLDLFVAAAFMKGYPGAKRDLVEWGFAAADVEAMPVAQVVAIHQSRVYLYAYHELFKWSFLPYSEAQQRWNEVEEKLRREGFLGSSGGKEIVPIVSMLLPAIGSASQAPLRVERHLAALRAIEAIRIHAAANDGALPKSLDAISAVPVPVNPANGEPFGYHVEGDKAFLEVTEPADGAWVYINKIYEITIRASKK